MGLEHGRIVDQGVDLRRLQHIGVVLQGAQGVQWCADASGELHGGDIGQDLRPVGRDDGDAAPHPQPFRLQRLDHPAGGLAYLPVGGDLVPQEEAGLIVVAVQAFHQQVGHQWRVVQGIGTHVISGCYC